MNEGLRERKRALRSFMQAQYTDERLVWLIEHARSGRLAFRSCCCFVGIVTADHPLCGYTFFNLGTADNWVHFWAAQKLPGAYEAEIAFNALGEMGRHDGDAPDSLRRRRIIPIARAEQRRRQREGAAQQRRRTWIQIKPRYAAELVRVCA